MKSVKIIFELTIRLLLAYIFIKSGLGKFNNLASTIEYFESLHIPLSSVQAPLVAIIEFTAGLFILIGLRTRFAAIALIIIMTVALFTAKKEEIENISQILETSEFLYILLLLNLVAHGSKYISFDLYMSENKLPAKFKFNKLIL